MAEDFRVGVYYAPAVQDPLHAAGATWLGRDPETGASVRQPDIANLAELTADPLVYGFHATLKPPMRLRPGRGWSDVVAAAEAVARTVAPFELPPMQVRDLHGFLALRETSPSDALQGLADACVSGLDELRAPASEAELARRRRSPLSPAQDAMLTRWGYPYVFSTWFFHMTLTRRLTADEKARVQPQAEAFFTPALTIGRRVSEICLFTQRGPGEPFLIAQRVPLSG